MTIEVFFLLEIVLVLCVAGGAAGPACPSQLPVCPSHRVQHPLSYHRRQGDRGATGSRQLVSNMLGTAPGSGSSSVPYPTTLNRYRRTGIYFYIPVPVFTVHFRLEKGKHITNLFLICYLL